MNKESILQEYTRWRELAAVGIEYEEVKDHPLFVIKEICGGGNHEITN